MIPFERGEKEAYRVPHLSAERGGLGGPSIMVGVENVVACLFFFGLVLGCICRHDYV